MDSDFENCSLKDSVWNLTARVLVLESFIARQFGANALQDVAKRDAINSTKINSPASTKSSTHRSSVEKEKQSQEKCSSIRRTRRINYNQEKETDECSSDNWYTLENQLHLVTKTYSRERPSTNKNAKDNVMENSSDEYCPNYENGDTDTKYIALLEPKIEIITDEIQNDEDTEMEFESFAIQPNKPSLTQHEKTSEGTLKQEADDVSSDEDYEANVKAKTCHLIRTFEDEETGRCTLASQNWRFVGRHKRPDGNRIIYYRCGGKKSLCPARGHLLVTPQEEVHFYGSSMDHENCTVTTTRSKPWGLTPKTKQRIVELIKLKFKTMKILQMLKEEGFQAEILQLRNYIQQYRKSFKKKNMSQ